MANPLVAFIERPYMQRKNAHLLKQIMPRGVYEQKFVAIGGIPQWVTIRGQDRTNPVLLILHGI